MTYDDIHLYSIQFRLNCPCTWCTVYRFALAEPHLYIFLRLKQGLTSFWHLSTISFKLNYWKWLKTIFVTDRCWRWFGDALLSCNSGPMLPTHSLHQTGPLQVFAAETERARMDGISRPDLKQLVKQRNKETCNQISLLDWFVFRASLFVHTRHGSLYPRVTGRAAGGRLHTRYSTIAWPWQNDPN
jgi:hypothetical protein